jgi:hypothetical protein
VAIDAAREDRVRRLAATQGLLIVESANPRSVDDEDAVYVLVRDVAEADSAFANGYGMTLSDVERALNP